MVHLPEEEGNPEITETTDISVSVTDENEIGLNNVEVTLVDTNDNTNIFTGTTGTAGGCNLTNVPTGEYEVTATKTGYITYTSLVTVTTETNSLTIEMTEE